MLWRENWLGGARRRLVWHEIALMINDETTIDEFLEQLMVCAVLVPCVSIGREALPICHMSEVSVLPLAVPGRSLPYDMLIAGYRKVC